MLSERLKAARERANLSQIEVAQAMNISRQSVSKWETGRTYPDLDNLVILSDLYKVSLDELLKSEDSLKIQKKKETKKKDEKIKNDYDFLMSHEELSIAATAVLTCFIPVIGILTDLILIVYCIVKKTPLSLGAKFIIFITMLINLSNTVVFFDLNFWHSGKATIEKIAFLNTICF